MKSQRLKTISFWIATGIMCFELLYGATWDFNLLNKGYAGSVLLQLGYPNYLSKILGTAKILAAFAILIPGFLILKECAYAGSVFIFVGAVLLFIIRAGCIGFNSTHSIPVFYYCIILIATIQQIIQKV
jgi:hypothetical protein